MPGWHGDPVQVAGHHHLTTERRRCLVSEPLARLGWLTCARFTVRPPAVR